MPSKSKAQHRLMQAVAHSPAFAKKVGIPVSVGQDFSRADEGRKFQKGGTVESPSLLALRDYASKVAGDMYHSTNVEGDQRDAARHLLAAGTVALKYSPEVAKRLGLLHEYASSPGAALGTLFGGKMPVDFAMDRHNNEVGANLANCVKDQAALERYVNWMTENASMKPEPNRAYITTPPKPQMFRTGGQPEMEHTKSSGSVQPGQKNVSAWDVISEQLPRWWADHQTKDLREGIQAVVPTTPMDLGLMMLGGPTGGLAKKVGAGLIAAGGTGDAEASVTRIPKGLLKFIAENYPDALKTVRTAMGNTVKTGNEWGVAHHPEQTTLIGGGTPNSLQIKANILNTLRRPVRSPDDAFLLHTHPGGDINPSFTDLSGTRLPLGGREIIATPAPGSPFVSYSREGAGFSGRDYDKYTDMIASHVQTPKVKEFMVNKGYFDPEYDNLEDFGHKLGPLTYLRELAENGKADLLFNDLGLHRPNPGESMPFADVLQDYWRQFLPVHKKDGGPVQHFDKGGQPDSIKETPEANSILAAFARGLKATDAFARKPFGYDNPPAAAVSSLLGLPAIQRVLERAGYGEPLTNVGKANVPLLPEDTSEALMAAPQFLSPAMKLAQLTKGLPVGAIIKDPGGNWLTGSVESALKGLKQRVPVPEEATLRTPWTAQDAIEAARPAAINKFIEGPLTRYVKGQMATEKDPIRALAEQGILHVNPEQVGLNRYRAPRVRQAAGFPAEGVGVSPAAQAWEAASDVVPMKGTYETHMPLDEYITDETKVDALRRLGGDFAVNNPHAAAYAFDRGQTADALGFTHLTDELRNALNPESGLPRNLLLTPEKMHQMGIEKAVRHVDAINKWREAQVAEANAKRANNAATVLHKEYPHTPETPNPKGLRWVELKAPELPDEEVLKLSGTVGGVSGGRGALQDALKYEGDVMKHCVGGYCPDVAEGRSRIFSLRDAKGEPHVTVETEPDPMPYAVSGEAFARLSPAEKAQYREHVMQWRRRNPDVEDLTDEHTTQALIEAGVAPKPDRIVQIKGKSNLKPKDEYIPFVQDFVKSGQWSDVGDYANTGLVKIDPASDLAAQLKALGEDVPAHVTQDELTSLLDRFRKPGLCTGGPVPMPPNTQPFARVPGFDR